jgi:hypothetical protein
MKGIETIICKNATAPVIEKVQEYLDKGGILKSIRIMDQTDDQIVLLVGSREITQDMAEMFWQGWQSALG